MNPTLPLLMYIQGTFATGQEAGLHIIWTHEPLGSFASSCTGPPSVPSPPSPSNATPSSTLR